MSKHSKPEPDLGFYVFIGILIGFVSFGSIVLAVDYHGLKTQVDILQKRIDKGR